MESRNPATGELVATIEEHSSADVAARLAGARAAFPPGATWDSPPAPGISAPPPLICGPSATAMPGS